MQSFDTEKPLIITFLQRLNIARRNLSIYPPEHPAIAESISRALEILQEFYHSTAVISIGIGPAAVYFEQIKFGTQDLAVRDFCHFFSDLGIATVSFLSGVTAEELVRFNQLLRNKRDQIEELGGFEALLVEQRISRIQVIPIDYEAFQARTLDDRCNILNSDVWEDFLYGLSRGILDFDGTDSQEMANFARLLNSAWENNSTQDSDYEESLTRFIDRSLYSDQPQRVQMRAGNSINTLLKQLDPEARDHFLNRILQALNNNPTPARNILAGISPEYFHDALSEISQNNQKLSSRLIDLVKLFSSNDDATVHKKRSQNSFSGEIVRARLNELFREEQQETYLPDQYQVALADVFSNKVDAYPIPQDVQAELLTLIEEQSIEHHFSVITIKLLENCLSAEQETAIQDHLLELTKFHLDIGDFQLLRKIYHCWNSRLNSGQAHLDIFAEKILAAHTQKSFIAEVLDGFDIWEEDRHEDLMAYIEEVGAPYIPLTIELLGLAPRKEERMRWLKVLKKIGADAQQTIIEAMKDERWYLIRNLLSILGQTPNQQTLKASLPFCSHEHPQVRAEAIANVLKTNPATGNRYLLQELGSEDEQTREAAIKISSLSKDPAVINCLHALIQSAASSEAEFHQQKIAVHSLGHITNNDTLIVFRRLLMKKGLFMSQRMKALQQEIIKILPYFSGPTAEKLITELKRGKYKVHIQTALSNHNQDHHEII